MFSCEACTDCMADITLRFIIGESVATNLVADMVFVLGGLLSAELNLKNDLLDGDTISKLSLALLEVDGNLLRCVSSSHFKSMSDVLCLTSTYDRGLFL